MTARRRIAVLSAGGTITSMPSGGFGVSPSLGAEAILDELPSLGHALELEPHTVCAVASSDLAWNDVLAIAAEVQDRLTAGVDGVVVVQGTDTIEETAFALDLLHGGSEPVVVTGAMRHPGLPGADGPGNLATALAAVAGDHLRDVGVIVAAGDELHAARWVRKVQTTRPAAFASPTAGPVGWVTESRLRLATRPRRLPTYALPSRAVPPVALLPVPLGDDGRLIRTARAAGYAGVVVEAFGGGHVPSAALEALTEVAGEMPVVLASRCVAGEGLRGTYDFPGSEHDLLRRGLVSAGALSGPKARVLLSLLLALRGDIDDIVVQFCAVRDHLTW